jgi:hypothetical protein
VSPKASKTRTQKCTAAQARHRLANAREQLDVAEFWAQFRATLRRATALVEFAEAVIARG